MIISIHLIPDKFALIHFGGGIICRASVVLLVVWSYFIRNLYRLNQTHTHLIYDVSV